MPKARSAKPTLDGAQEELVALAVLLLKRQAESQSELAREMNAVGFSNARAAELLGTTPGTINQAVQKAKRAKAKAGKKGAKGNG
jgi:SOS response regulatory protein OraA/RecX